MEGKKRSFAKALSWRFMAMLITALVAWVMTGEWLLAASLGLADSAVKIGAFYLHERAWNRIAFGRLPQPSAESMAGSGI